MSSIANWTYTDTVTIWPSNDADEWGSAPTGEPYTVSASWEIGGELSKDDNGVEFSPSSTIYFEAEAGSDVIPESGSFIAIGDQTSETEPTDGAEYIRKVGGWSMSAFGESLNDYYILTGKSRV